jgi:hypothetical protein
MGFESEFKFFKKEFKTVKFWSRPVIHDQFYTENLPILGGQKAAVSASVNGWCAAGNIVQTDGQRDDGDGWRDGRVQGRVHLSSRRLLIYIMLASFNFPEIRNFLGRPASLGEGPLWLLWLLCWLENYIQTLEGRSSYFSYVSNFLICFFTNERVLYTCEGCTWRAFQIFALSWRTSLADVKCERPSIRNLLL